VATALERVVVVLRFSKKMLKKRSAAAGLPSAQPTTVDRIAFRFPSAPMPQP
jgi:hypothetical protein